jgi:hypothetical protein
MRTPRACGACVCPQGNSSTIVATLTHPLLGRVELSCRRPSAPLPFMLLSTSPAFELRSSKTHPVTVLAQKATGSWQHGSTAPPRRRETSRLWQAAASRRPK